MPNTRRPFREEAQLAGLYLEEFQAGQVIKHALRRSVTESDNIQFSMMTMNPQPLHIDFAYAAESEWGKPLMNSLFTLGLVIGISVHETTLGTIVANLGMTDVAFPHPLFHGDTIRVESEVKSVRESKSKPDRGIVEMEHRAYNQHDKLVARCLRQTMIYKRPAA
jgi:acyl dehydratase